jgi:hypothetical protein
LWPSAKPEHASHLSPYQLRILADELDRRNAPWQAVIDAEFSSENNLETTEIYLHASGMKTVASQLDVAVQNIIPMHTPTAHRKAF